MVKLYKSNGETLEDYNELLKTLFVEEKLAVLDEAIVEICGVKLRNAEDLLPVLKGICESFLQDQVILGMQAPR